MNKLVLKYPIIGSSANSTKLALTVQGILVALIPLIIGIGRAYNLEIAEADLTGLIQAIGGAISAVMVLYGLGRKAYNKYR